MLLIIFALGGVIFLFFLMRYFTRHHKTLDEYRHEQLLHTEAVHESIRHFNDSLEPSEAIRPILAGLRELQQFNHKLLPFNLEELPDGVARICTQSHPPRILEISWHKKMMHLSSMNRNLEGHGHWHVTESDSSRDFYDLNELMHALETTLHPGAKRINATK